MVFVRCSKCGGTIGALNFATLHSEMSWREWGIFRNDDGSHAANCPRCLAACKPDHLWRGVALAVHGDVLRTLVETCDG